MTNRYEEFIVSRICLSESNRLTRQTNVFKMMVKAYGDYQQMAEKAADAEGVTEANQEKYAESLKGHMQELKAVGESFWTNVLDSEGLKVIVDALTTLLKILDKIGSTLGGFGTLGLGVGLFAGLKNVGRRRQIRRLHLINIPTIICVLAGDCVFHIIGSEIHCCKRSRNMRGNSYTVWYSPHLAVKIHTLELSAGIGLMTSPHCSDNRWSRLYATMP